MYYASVSTQIKASNNFPESQLVKIWQQRLPYLTDLTTEDGEPIRIIYPGRINDDRGADFRDAVIATSQRLLQGDIEIHVKSSSWRGHRHHLDPIFNRVILHVVFWHDTRAATSLQNGERVAILTLHKYIHLPINCSTGSGYPGLSTTIPCCKSTWSRDKDFIGEVLDSAGEERFLAKSASFQEDLVQTEAGQSLYQGMMAALGYTKNKLPFLELARRVPLQSLESVTRRRISDTDCLARQQALLLGTAGLLPSQCSNRHGTSSLNRRWIDTLEKVWAPYHQTDTMSESDWHLFKVRPNNLPTRRIAAMSHLVVRYRQNGILDRMVNTLKETPLKAGCHELAKAVMVTADTYRARYSDSSPPHGLIIPTLLGSRRAGEIIVNVLLPFIFAWSKVTSQPQLNQKAIETYYRYPRLAVNTMERHMCNQLKVNSDLIDSARRQQGLIHIYKTMCVQGKCHCCPLGE